MWTFHRIPEVSHIKKAKRIVRYVKKTGALVLFYAPSDSFELVGYANDDFAGYQVERKRTSRMAYFLGSSLISWGTKKEKLVALSVDKVKYVAAASCCAQHFWIKQQLKDFRVHINISPLICDNTNAVNMGKNPV